MKLLMCYIFVLCAIGWVDSLKILGVFSMPTYSHYSVGKRLVEALAEKGHDVTVLGPFPEKDAKFKHIHLDTLLPKIEEFKKEVNMFEMSNMPQFLGIPFMHQMGLILTQLTFDHLGFKKVIASNETFDLVIFEQCLNDAYRGICNHYNAPCVIVTSIESNAGTNIPTGNPHNPAYIAGNIVNLHFGSMNFFERLQNTLTVAFEEIFVKLWAIQQQDKAMRTVFPKAPPLDELLYEPALYLLNSHISTAAPVPLLPNMIEIGGFHVKPTKKLPEDLQKYLDDATEGVVYFSMGSNLVSKDFPIEKRNAFLQAFSKLKLKVLWKFEEVLPGKPANVKISKWLPQNDS